MRRRTSISTWGLVLVVCELVAGCETVPITGRSPLNLISPSEEIAMGAQAYHYMAKAGYDPHAARDLWVRMAAAAKGKERPPQFLSTHPSEETRVQQIEGWLPEALKYDQPPRERGRNDSMRYT